MKKVPLLLLACIGLTVFSGILRGRIDSRWGREEMTASAERIESMPKTLGMWHADELSKLSDSASRMLRCEGNVVGSYVEESTGHQVSMVFLVGPTGPLAVHTPEVCYGSNNFSVVENRAQKIITDVDGTDHEFSVITFKENRAGNRLLRVYYAWNYDGNWRSPAHPRTSFAGRPMLHKIQIATHALTTNGEADAGERFLIDNLPNLGALIK